jgi:hypothetical protein
MILLVIFASLFPKYLTEQLKGRRIYFGSCFQKFQSMFCWPHVLGWNIIVAEECGRGMLFISWQTGSRERQERAREKILPRTCPRDLLLQLGPTS